MEPMQPDHTEFFKTNIFKQTMYEYVCNVNDRVF